MKSTDHMLWFFSTCAQTFATLVSVFGMFVLYRLQIEEDRIGALRKRMLSLDESHLKLPFDAVLKKITQKEIECRLAGETDHSQTIRTLMQDHAGALKKRAWLSRHARRSVVWLIGLTFWSLMGLVLYPYYASSWIAHLSIWVTLAICIIPLYQVGKIISISITLD